jgi:hypothetical protein
MMYQAEMIGPKWKQGPIKEWSSVTAACAWAEEFATDATSCTISRSDTGVIIAIYERVGNRWELK